MKLDATNQSYQLWETSRIKGESFSEKIFKEHHELDGYVAREIRKVVEKQYEESLKARKGEIKPWWEFDEEDDED